MRISAAILAVTISLRPASAQELTVYFIDVDQADATLIVSPSGNSLLIDSGKNGHGPRLQAVMQTAGINQIDHFVATHYHEDHYGGIDDLVEAGITMVNSYDRGDKVCCVDSSRKAGETFQDYQAAVGHRADHLTRGETIPLDPSMVVTVISSGGVVLREPDPPNTGENENDMSIGLLIRFGDFHMWVGGDAEQTTEEKIAELDLVTDLDVYQANHHGAEDASSLPFLQDVSPTVIVISNGSHGTYDHPRESTLARMQSLTPAPTIFQLNQYLDGDPRGGNIDEAFIADPETSDADGTIALTVDEAEGTYEVTYGTVTHTFDIKERATGTVVIEALLPDPTEDRDRMAETVTLRNGGSTPAPMEG